MYHPTSPSAYSWISAKAYGDNSPTVSSAWSDINPDPSVYPGQQRPNAPLIASVPLPGSNLNTPSHGHAVSLHDVLVYDRGGRLLLNLVHPFRNLRFRPQFASSVMNEYALTPRSACLSITIPGIPVWSLNVMNPAGVTVADVLTKIYAFFHTPVDKEEFITFPGQVQYNSSTAFSRRTTQNPVEYALGVKRLDLISPNFYVVGLTRAMDGSDRWDIRLAPSIGD